jgi:hypothetical protein
MNVFEELLEVSDAQRLYVDAADRVGICLIV